MIVTRPALRRSPMCLLARCAARRYAALLFIFLFALAGISSRGQAHPLGNFTINHFAGIEVDSPQIRIRFVVDMAEIAAFQELQKVDVDGDGRPSNEELNSYLDRIAPQYANGLLLMVDGSRIPLEAVAKKISLPPGAGGLPTLRVECDFAAALPSAGNVSTTRRLHFENTNHSERIGWHEVVVGSASGVSVFDGSAFGTSVTNELKAYPEDMIAAPLDERAAELSFTSGAPPAGAKRLLARDGQPIAPASRDRLAELIAVRELSSRLIFLALGFAMVFGALHAFSPGHGKAVVGAYLVGSRGTPSHALFLGLTVTITHTLGVFVLGLVTLFASQYVLPERLFPILSLISGALVLSIGLSLFVRRLRDQLGGAAHAHDHHHGHDHPPHAADSQHQHLHEHSHDEHSHGGRSHSHLPPGADGSPVTWRNLLALGISGGLLPCPSALVVLLSAISLHRTGFGLLLVLAFSIGLAGTLTGVGLLFLYAGRLTNLSTGSSRLTRVLPVVSAFVVAALGAAICYEALGRVWMVSAASGFGSSMLFAGPVTISTTTPAGALSIVSLLALGLVFGLRHAIEADHLAAVSAIVSERKSLLSSSLVGGLWGIGHTISLLVAGIVVILLKVEIPARTALFLEFGVGLMLVALGANAIRKLARGGHLHLHWHTHGGHAHAHPHMHDGSAETEPHTHHGLRLGVRPLIVGMVHGLAGSAALMLIVLSTIKSPLVAFIYIAVFGIGSIGGMMLMSALVALPIHLTSGRFDRANFAVRGLAGLFSLCFGVFMIYQIGFVDGLFR